MNKASHVLMIGGPDRMVLPKGLTRISDTETSILGHTTSFDNYEAVIYWPTPKSALLSPSGGVEKVEEKLRRSLRIASGRGVIVVVIPERLPGVKTIREFHGSIDNPQDVISHTHFPHETISWCVPNIWVGQKETGNSRISQDATQITHPVTRLYKGLVRHTKKWPYTISSLDERTGEPQKLYGVSSWIEICDCSGNGFLMKQSDNDLSRFFGFDVTEKVQVITGNVSPAEDSLSCLFLWKNGGIIVLPEPISTKKQVQDFLKAIRTYSASRKRPNAFETNALSENKFKQNGEFWDIVFKGDTIPPIKDRKGMQYICRLLSTPNREFLSEDLYHHFAVVNPDDLDPQSSEDPLDNEREDGRVFGISYKVIDARTVNETRKYILDLQAEVEEEKKAGVPMDRINQKELEIDKCKKAIESADNRVFEDKKRKGSRQAVCAAINRTIDALKKTGADKLAAHLNKAIVRGKTLCYRSDLTWDT